MPQRFCCREQQETFLNMGSPSWRMIAGFHGAVPADVCLGAQRFAVVVGICQLRGNT
jgi:hypothetical protein